MGCCLTSKKNKIGGDVRVFTRNDVSPLNEELSVSLLSAASFNEKWKKKTKNKCGRVKYTVQSKGFFVSVNKTKKRDRQGELGFSLSGSSFRPCCVFRFCECWGSFIFIFFILFYFSTFISAIISYVLLVHFGCKFFLMCFSFISSLSLPCFFAKFVSFLGCVCVISQTKQNGHTHTHTRNVIFFFCTGQTQYGSKQKKTMAHQAWSVCFRLPALAMRPANIITAIRAIICLHWATWSAWVWSILPLDDDWTAPPIFPLSLSLSLHLNIIIFFYYFKPLIFFCFFFLFFLHNIF